MTKKSNKDIHSSAETKVDIDNISEETEIERIEKAIQKQEEQIEELQDLVLDLSTRVAHDGGVGVCPDCHGALVKTGGFLTLRTKIKCKRCGEVQHRY